MSAAEVTHKTCADCVKCLPVKDFNRKRTNGLQSYCRTCHSKRLANWYQANKARSAAKNAAWRQANPDKVRAAGVAAYWKDPEAHRLASRQYKELNREQERARSLAWRHQNLERARASDKSWKAANRDRVKATATAWQMKNRASCTAAQARRNAQRLRATPPWAEKEALEAFYETAQGLSMLTGEWYHVDHIVPMQSKFVCGLHCPANLCVIPGFDNQSKSNRYWPDMPEGTS